MGGKRERVVRRIVFGKEEEDEINRVRNEVE